MKRVKIIFIGAGPASLLAGHYLINHGFKDFLIFEKGLDLAGRNRKEKSRLCSVVHGVGGAGLFSDGKFNFSPLIGGQPLEVISPRFFDKFVTKLKEILDLRCINVDQKGITTFNKKFVDVNFLSIRQAHIGSDRLQEVIKNLIKGLEDKILINNEVIEIEKKENRYLVYCANGNKYLAQKIIIATGQKGSQFAVKIAEKFEIPVKTSCADIGVRLETKKEIFEPLTNLQYDPKIYFSFGNSQVRTFCTNSGGDVIVENKDSYVSVNGFANNENKTPYTNTALMNQISTIINPKEYSENLCRRISMRTNNKIAVQDIAEILGNDRFCDFAVRIPYEKRDVRKEYDAFIVEPIVKTLRKINEILNDQLCGYIYFPEIKLYNDTITIEKDSFKAIGNEEIYFLGDCSGIIHGLTNACLSGMSFAQNFITNNNCSN